MDSKIKVRIAPSPTGRLHIGTARTALFNYLFARKKGGEFLLRIEDLDRSRSSTEYEREIIAGLKWLGLAWDQGPIRQTERLEKGIYQKYLSRLVKNKLAYPCYCSAKELAEERKRQLARGLPPKYSGKCRGLKKKPKGKGKPVYRLNVRRVAREMELPSKLVFADLIRGEIGAEIGGIGDFILVKRDATPLYHFAVVIDDHEMGISHIIRGEDHITNTFNQLLLYRAFGWKPPKFAHLPLILNPDRSKLSKREKNLVSIADFQKAGYLPEAIINYLALLGWHPQRQGKEVFSLAEAVDNFQLNRVSPSGAIFERKKLDYLNGWYIREKKEKELLKLIEETQSIKIEPAEKELALKAISLIKERMRKLAQFKELTNYFFQRPNYEAGLLVFRKSTPIRSIQGLKTAYQTLEKADPKIWQKPEQLNRLLAGQVEKSRLTNGDIFWPVRVALSGRDASPSPSELLWALGREESLGRIEQAIKRLKIGN